MSKSRKPTWKETQKIKPQVKEGLKRNAFLRPREATKTSKKAFKASKTSFRLAKKTYRHEKKNVRVLLKQGKKPGTINHILAKKSYLELKTQKKVKKKIYRKTKARDTSRLSVQAKISVGEGTEQAIKQKLAQSLRQEDTLAEMTDHYIKYKQSKQNLRLGVKTGKTVGTGTIKLGKGMYGLGNRLLNFSRGRGFQRTPKEFTIRSRLLTRYRNHQRRVKEAKKAKESAHLLRSFLKGDQALGTIGKLLAKNPITWIIVVVFLLLFVIVGVLAGANRPAIVQKEKDLTEAWVYMTQVDAKNSSASTIFYSSLDDVMFYMNEQFGEYTLNDRVAIATSCKDYLTRLWTDLNGRPPDYSLKSMDELETDSDTIYYLPETNYKEFQERVKTFGYSTLEGQLAFPFQTKTLVVTRRYGYERHGDVLSLNKGIDVSLDTPKDIHSPMSGKVTSIPDDHTIQITEEGQRQLTIKGVSSNRFKGGELVQTGTLLGTSTKDHLTIQYQRYNKKQKTWVSVNPGFYFPKVTYTQTTILADDHFHPEKALEERAKAIYDYLTKLGFTREGIAAILGNFTIESSLNPKRAEGDYLAPPVGASANSWDDPAWLAMGGNEIYGGKYPTILHRGLGLGQWTDTTDGSVRHTMLLDYAKNKKKKWYDLKLQLDFLIHGDVPAYQTIAKNTAGRVAAATVPELTVYFLNNWEGNPGNKVNERIQAAQNWYHYFSDTSQDLDKSSKEVYEKYKNKMTPLPTKKETQSGWEGNAYAGGNCTWYVYNRMKQLGKSINPYMGNANQWVYNYVKTPGARLVDTPKRGDAIIFTNGVAHSSSLYGHVAMVEYVNPDGTFVISEMNVKGEYSMGWRVLRKEPGEYFMRVGG